jgi:hypothetical protein
MGAINRSDRITATLYSLVTWFVSGIYAKISCIKVIIIIIIVIGKHEGKIQLGRPKHR